MLGNRPLGAMALLAVCGAATMTVNLLVMDARAGHIGEISSTIDPKVSSSRDMPTADMPTADAIPGPSDLRRASSVAVLGTVITAPIVSSPSDNAPIASSPLAQLGDD